MKKLKSLSLLLLGMGMASCAFTPEEDLYTGEESYMHAFINEFGVIDPNHTWGFGTPDRPQSRGTYTDANDWWKMFHNVPELVTEEEAAYVANVFSTATADQCVTIDFKHFFIQQVYKSQNEYVTYRNQGGQTQIVQSDQKMNYLICCYEDPTTHELVEDHTNNGNDAVISQTLVYYTETDSHHDYAMRMENSGTKAFGYHNSLYTNQEVTDKFLILEIDVPNVGKGYYVGLDYSSRPNNDEDETFIDLTYTVTYTPTTITSKTTGDEDPEVTTTYGEPSTTGEQNINLQLDGFYSNVDELTEAIENWKTQKIAELTIQQTSSNSVENQEEGSTTQTTNTISNVSIDVTTKTIKGYKYGDARVDADGVYTDWILKITKAEYTDEYNPDPETEPEPTTKLEKRIMVEDLSIRANNNLQVNSSDWDFNDLVFDATIGEDGKAQIVLQALGGTLPIYIEDINGNRTNELHYYFGCDHRVIINTGVNPFIGPKDITTQITGLTFTKGDYNSIKIIVEDNGHEYTMTADTGKAPCKICVPEGTAYPREFQHIKDKFPGFRAWVEDEGHPFWQLNSPWQDSNSNGD